MLEYFRGWRSQPQIFRHFATYSRTSILDALREMLSSELVVEEGTSQALADAACEGAWRPWLPDAGVMHFGTKDAPYVEGAAATAVVEGLLQAAPQPPFSKRRAGTPVVKLPRPAGTKTTLLDSLFQRRTHRSFSPDPLRLDQLSALLSYVWGVTGYLEDPLLGRLPLKTSPSGGARHPEEVYVVALRVEGLKPGIYHYVPDHHCLEFIPVPAAPARAVEYCAGQDWVAGAAALFIMTAALARTMWKYPFPRAYRLLLTEAGHLCQTFCLVATALGLGPFCTMALKDSLIERDLGLDGFDEAVLYVAGVGVPQHRADARQSR
jgi:SagB-type dehydrogenase family enzyme